MKSTYINKPYQLPAVLTNGRVTILAIGLDSKNYSYLGTVINIKDDAAITLGEYRKTWSAACFFLSTEQIILEN